MIRRLASWFTNLAGAATFVVAAPAAVPGVNTQPALQFPC
jgi:hypothetical protein